jgi:ligand-binding sensor domain-containing protein
LPDGSTVRQLTRSPQGERHAATTTGLWVEKGGRWERIIVADGLGRQWATADVRGVAFDSRGQSWFASLAGVGCRGQEGWRFYDGRDGLPWNDFTCVAAGPNGVVWFGARRGAIRWDGNEFHYRQGPRWLPDDEVRAIAVAADGTARFATAHGVGELGRRR